MVCSRCGSTVDSIHGFCPVCGSIIESVSQKDKILKTETVPWESKPAKDFPIAALVDTVQESFFQADYFFSKVNKSKCSSSAWIYGLITGSIGMLAAFLWSFFLPDLSSDSQISSMETAQSLIFTPFIISFQILLITVYIHFMLFLTKSRNAPIGATFRVSSYALGALILNAIPAVGPFLATILWLYLIITGIHQVHLINKWKAATILILPFIILFLLLLATIMIFVIGGLLAGNLSKSLFPFF